MANHVLLDNVAHSKLRIITDRAERYGDDVICTAVFPIEFRKLQPELCRYRQVYPLDD